MAEFHFVEDYERHVAELIASHPIDEAMALAVGGSFKEIGQIEVNILRAAGLRDGMHLMDLGCGSGRLAASLIASHLQIGYTGTDIVQPLLDYAATITPSHYVYKLHRDLSVPAETGSLDMICAFSLFTHLLHHETYLYLQDGFRSLKKGGSFVFSFLELALPQHWDMFNATVADLRIRKTMPLNSFIERVAIEKWASALGFDLVAFDPPNVISGTSALGQSVVILRK